VLDLYVATVRADGGHRRRVSSKEHDVRLGDVVVSKPTDTSGGVIKYDFGKTVQVGRFRRTGLLNKPPAVLLGAVTALNIRHMVEERCCRDV
jgi:hypothetical protein